MLETRVLPCLLLRGRGLVKTVRFRAPRYLGDALNAVRIFNQKQVDELLLLDIEATPEKRPLQLELIRRIARECAMPLAVGGGVDSIERARALFECGVEKVAINSAAVTNPGLIGAIAEEFGSQSVVAAMDVRRRWGAHEVLTHGGRVRTRLDPVTHARSLEAAGAGELLVTSVDRDGTMEGYDLALTRSVAEAVRIPVIACGGAGTLADLGRAAREGGASAVAAGSLFVFHGPRRAVLISFPTRAELGPVLAH